MYQAMIVREHRRCGGWGWHIYDAAFRQKISSLESADFGKINQALYSTTLACGKEGEFFPTCMQSDHQPEDYALHPNRAWALVQFRERHNQKVAAESRKGGKRGHALHGMTGSAPADFANSSMCVPQLPRGPQEGRVHGQS